MWYESVRKAYESMVPGNGSREAQLAGSTKFVEAFRRDLGLAVNERGTPTLRDPKLSPGEFSVRGLAEALVGAAWVERLGRAQAQDFVAFEAAGPAAITPSNIPNVSAFLGSVTGLLDAQILHAYEAPGYIIDSLVDVIPSKTRSKRLIGAGNIGDDAHRRNPGEGHAFVSFEERYVQTPETYNDALALAVTFETVFYDQTGEILDRANKIGEALALRKEKDGFKVLVGASNPYNYRGVAYNTYLTTGTPWLNDQVQLLEDWTDINAVNALFALMTDQETGERITVDWDTLLCSPVKQMTAEYIESATEVETVTASGAQVRRGKRLGDTKSVVSSVVMNQVLTTAAAAGGLALSQAVADEYWFCLKTTKGSSAFVRIENWPVTVNRAAPNSFTMLNQKLLLAVFADQMHVFAAREPRYVVRNKPA